MVNIYFKVKFNAGTIIDDACREALELCKRLAINVEFDFNGIVVHVTPTSTCLDLVNRFNDELRINSK